MQWRGRTAAATAIAIAAMAVAWLAYALAASPADNRWGGLLSRYERQNSEIEALADGIIFMGSSSIRGWAVDVYFPEYETLNRGLGGSRIPDLVHHMDILLAEHRPAMIVLYAGENDIDAGLSPDQVLEEYRALVGAIRQRLPKVEIVILKLKLAPSRVRLAEGIDAVNRKLEHWAGTDDSLTLIGDDIRKSGTYVVDDAIFRKDRLHLNEVGYQRWSEELRRILGSRRSGGGISGT